MGSVMARAMGRVTARAIGSVMARAMGRLGPCPWVGLGPGLLLHHHHDVNVLRVLLHILACHTETAIESAHSQKITFFYF